MIDRIIGNYRIVEKLGEGGMGAVYRALDLMLEREVAIKAIRPELAREPEIVERFRAEAKMLARVNHPAIATIYSFFQQGEDIFLAMEFVRGETLSRLLLRQGAMPWEQAVALLAVALEGIEQAHRAGIVHRDLKPDNLMITENGALKVMDFGIARMAGTSRMTRTGLLVGTLRYMAPEQIRGEEVDRRTDLYALGTVLYEMVTGRVPFDGNSDYAVLKAQVEEKPAPPSLAMPQIPAWLDGAILRSLAKDPPARFSTVEELRVCLLTQGQRTTSSASGIAVAPAATIAGSETIAHLPTMVRPMPRPPGQEAPSPPVPDGAASGMPAGSESGFPTAAAGDAPAGSDQEAALRRGRWDWKRAAAAAALVLLLAGAGLATLSRLSLRHGGASPPRAEAAVAARRFPASAGPRSDRKPAMASSGVLAAGAPPAATPAAGASAAGSPQRSAATTGAGAVPGGAGSPIAIARPGTAASSGATPGASGAAGPESRRRKRPSAAGSERTASSAALPAAGAGGVAAQPPMPATPAAGGGNEAARSAGAGGELPTEELRQIGGELQTAGSEIHNLYADYLKERAGSQQQKAGSPAAVAPPDARLRDELSSFQSAVERFNQLFSTKFFTRMKNGLGRFGRGEDQRAQIVRFARALGDSGARVDALIAEANPAPAVREAWQRIRRQRQRIAEICAL
ncbi:MAG TPA: protein kinase [Thermoanaerobaculia bacterium]|nr:protein kinase [Thermoanaerobaculia bacterium]